MLHTTPTTVHLYYDLQKAGYRGYDRRHYPSQTELSTNEIPFVPRALGSASISSNRDEDWRPHGRYIEPKYTNVGPDWQSRLRSLSAPQHPNAKPTLPVALIERNIRVIRPYPQNWLETKNEWQYFTDNPIDCQSSKRTHFNQIHLRSVEDLGDDDMLMSQIGRKKKVTDLRNGLKQRSEGDKSYQTVEQSVDFYKFGATVPQVNFGREKQRYGNRKTFVPMKNEKFAIVDEIESIEKRQQRERQTNVDDVIQLEKWKPAKRISSAFPVFESDPNDKTGNKYRPRVR